MLSKVLFLAVVAVSSAQHLAYNSAYSIGSQSHAYGAPHVGVQSEQTVRGFAGSSISHQQKAVDSAFSTVRKTDTRITNPQLYAAAPAVYQHAAPAVYQHAAPAVYQHASPVYSQTYAAAPAFASAPVYQTAALPAYNTYAHAPLAAAPLTGYAAPAVARVGSPLLGVQYSAVQPGVASLSFNGYGINYGY